MRAAQAGRGPGHRAGRRGGRWHHQPEDENDASRADDGNGCEHKTTSGQTLLALPSAQPWMGQPQTVSLPATIKTGAQPWPTPTERDYPIPFDAGRNAAVPARVIQPTRPVIAGRIGVRATWALLGRGYCSVPRTAGQVDHAMEHPGRSAFPRVILPEVPSKHASSIRSHIRVLDPAWAGCSAWGSLRCRAGKQRIRVRSQGGTRAAGLVNGHAASAVSSCLAELRPLDRWPGRTSARENVKQAGAVYAAAGLATVLRASRDRSGAIKA